MVHPHTWQTVVKTKPGALPWSSSSLYDSNDIKLVGRVVAHAILLKMLPTCIIRAFSGLVSFVRCQIRCCRMSARRIQSMKTVHAVLYMNDHRPSHHQHAKFSNWCPRMPEPLHMCTFNLDCLVCVWFDPRLFKYSIRWRLLFRRYVPC